MARRIVLLFSLLVGVIAAGPAAAQPLSAEDLQGRWRSSWSNYLGVAIDVIGGSITMLQRFRSDGRICQERLNGRIRGRSAQVRSTGISCDGAAPSGAQIACTLTIETRDRYTVRCGETGHRNTFHRIED
jgi:hypothetical protein